VRKRINITIDPLLLERVDGASRVMGITRSAMIAISLQRALVEFEFETSRSPTRKSKKKTGASKPSGLKRA